MVYVFLFKQKTAYEMRISDWSSDVCSSDLELDHYLRPGGLDVQVLERFARQEPPVVVVASMTSIQRQALFDRADDQGRLARSVLRRARQLEDRKGAV